MNNDRLSIPKIVYFCSDDIHRRQLVENHPTLNGIDFLEVDSSQTKLEVHFLKSLDLDKLTAANLRIEGGDRIREITVNAEPIVNDKVLTVSVNKSGDFSIYTLRLVTDEIDLHRLDNFDLILRAVDFSFKVNCPTDLDCCSENLCPPEPQPQPEINYLAKDYASFRQLILDRLALIMPQWKERNPADLGITLVELLAYVGDYLSYQQDAIATEAYLSTARRRISVRRHARLVDYWMHNGCTARVWVQFQVNAEVVLLKRGTKLLTPIPKQVSPILSDFVYQEALSVQPEVFETMHDSLLFSAHNDLHFYTWENRECCLPKGAIRATLCDSTNNRLRLCVGDILILEERYDPKTGIDINANLTHRHAVRLTKVYPEATRLLQEGREIGRTAAPSVFDPLTGQPIVQIEWDTEDALPFPLCISAEKENGEYFEVSLALGNIVLADRGRTLETAEILGKVPESQLLRVATVSQKSCCEDVSPKRVPPRFYPHLKEAPLTYADPYQPTASAFRTMQPSPQRALPAIALTSQLNGKTFSWTPQRDLLNSRPDSLDFVVEVEADGRAYLRFGNGEQGYRPPSDTEFRAVYRVGNGGAGQIGADAIAHAVSNDPNIVAAVLRVRNPLPAFGGVEPETMEDVRQKAPAAFRTQERAVTPEDYATVAQRYPQIQKAAATFRWTGSWYTVFVTADRLGGLPVDATFENNLRSHLEKYRMAGHDLEIDAPRFVSLAVEMQVCVKSNYFRSHVKSALLELFSNRLLADGRKGVFHPDNFTFGQPVYLSRLYEAALTVAGVKFVTITQFERQGTPSQEALEKGFLQLGRLEIARLDNDPNFPERGIFQLRMEGGK
ncbi:MAG TPA: putative baseplate assembly protein [Leptolyngbyaceae cyanobacterium]